MAENLQNLRGSHLILVKFKRNIKIKGRRDHHFLKIPLCHDYQPNDQLYRWYPRAGWSQVGEPRGEQEARRPPCPVSSTGFPPSSTPWFGNLWDLVDRLVRLWEYQYYIYISVIMLQFPTWIRWCQLFKTWSWSPLRTPWWEETARSCLLGSAALAWSG